MDIPRKPVSAQSCNLMKFIGGDLHIFLLNFPPIFAGFSEMVFFIAWVCQCNAHKLALFTDAMHIILPFCSSACPVSFAVQASKSCKSFFLQGLRCNFAQQSMILITQAVKLWRKSWLICLSGSTFLLFFC